MILHIRNYRFSLQYYNEKTHTKEKVCKIDNRMESKLMDQSRSKTSPTTKTIKSFSNNKLLMCQNTHLSPFRQYFLLDTGLIARIFSQSLFSEAVMLRAPFGTVTMF